MYWIEPLLGDVSSTQGSAGKARQGKPRQAKATGAKGTDDLE